MEFIYIHKDETEDHYLNVPNQGGLEGLGPLILVSNVEHDCLTDHLLVINRKEFNQKFSN